MSFPLAGNACVKSTVESIINSGNMPHAILIEGDDGIGKHTLASYIAKAYLCDGDDKPCNKCKHCHLCDISSHPDVAFIEPEEKKKNVLVDKIRELRAEAFVRPHMADGRVFIIEKMNEQSQNALLKVLEEPPQNVIFIILAKSRTTLLQTIVSRCFTLTLDVPDRKSAFAAIKAVFKATDENINSALTESGNNIGKALQFLSKKSKNSTRETADEFLRLLFSGNEYEMLKLLAPLEKDRVKADNFFEDLKEQTALSLKKNYKSISKSKILSALYSEITAWQELLKTNINLPLLFSAAVCKAKSITQ